MRAMVTVAALAVLLWGLGFVLRGLLLAMWSMWRRQRIERMGLSVASRRIGSGLLALTGAALIAVTVLLVVLVAGRASVVARLRAGSAQVWADAHVLTTQLGREIAALEQRLAGAS